MTTRPDARCPMASMRGGVREDQPGATSAVGPVEQAEAVTDTRDDAVREATPAMATDAAGAAAPDAAAVATLRHPIVTNPVRWIFMAVGLLCVGLGAIGSVVPGMPTTVFLLLAAFFFARSCPALERWLMEHRVFGPYLKAVAHDRCMPLAAKVLSLAMMWAAVTASIVAIGIATPRRGIASMSVVCLALIGSWFICVWLRTGRPRASQRG